MKTEKVLIHTPFIKLDAFLKLAGAVTTGGEAKIAIASGAVCLKNEVCLLRGKKLYVGDIVEFDGNAYEVCS